MGGGWAEQGEKIMGMKEAKTTARRTSPKVVIGETEKTRGPLEGLWGAQEEVPVRTAGTLAVCLHVVGTQARDQLLFVGRGGSTGGQMCGFIREG